MKRLLTASVAALALMAGQASAVTPTLTSLNVTDRTGSEAQAASEFMGLSPWVLALIAAGLIGIIIAVSNNNDGPSSP